MEIRWSDYTNPNNESAQANFPQMDLEPEFTSYIITTASKKYFWE